MTRLTVAGGLAAALTCLSPIAAMAQSISASGLDVLGHLLSFMQPPPPADGTVAIAFAAGDAESRADAEAIARQIGDALRGHGITLRPRLADTAALASMTVPVVIAAVNAPSAQFANAVRAAHALCVTADLASVQAGDCTMLITTEPRVSIIMNHALAEASGVTFLAAFRMMIREF